MCVIFRLDVHSYHEQNIKDNEIKSPNMDKVNVKNISLNDSVSSSQSNGLSNEQTTEFKIKQLQETFEEIERQIMKHKMSQQ